MIKTQTYTDNRTMEEYKVTNFENYTDGEILDFCDCNAFGGEVRRYDDCAIAILYID